MTNSPRPPKGQTFHLKAHDLDGERRIEGLKLTLTPSVSGEEKMGEMELPLVGKARVVKKKRG